MQLQNQQQLPTEWIMLTQKAIYWEDIANKTNNEKKYYNRTAEKQPRKDIEVAVEIWKPSSIKTVLTQQIKSGNSNLRTLITKLSAS